MSKRHQNPTPVDREIRCNRIIQILVAAEYDENGWVKSVDHDGLREQVSLMLHDPRAEYTKEGKCGTAALEALYVAVALIEKPYALAYFRRILQCY